MSCLATTVGKFIP